jgi:hypothetical protein
MAVDLSRERERAHAYLDQLPAAQLTAVRRLLESMVDPLSRALANAPPDDEEIAAEEAESIKRSRDWFQHNQGTSFDDFVAELGFTMDDIRNHKEPD